MTVSHQHTCRACVIKCATPYRAGRTLFCPVPPYTRIHKPSLKSIYPQLCSDYKGKQTELIFFSPRNKHPVSSSYSYI